MAAAAGDGTRKERDGEKQTYIFPQLWGHKALKLLSFLNAMSVIAGCGSHADQLHKTL